MQTPLKTRGYFGIGIEEVSKPGNMGNLIRSAHAFGASFVFTIQPGFSKRELMKADTSATFDTLPYFQYDRHEDMHMPLGCQLVVIELTDAAIALPSFRHPKRAAYVLGPEKESVSKNLQDRADHIIQIPMKFCVNVATAGAIVLYDRLLQQGRFPDRPVGPGGPLETLKPHIHGGVFSRQKKDEPQSN